MREKSSHHRSSTDRKRRSRSRSSRRQKRRKHDKKKEANENLELYHKEVDAELLQQEERNLSLQTQANRVNPFLRIPQKTNEEIAWTESDNEINETKKEIKQEHNDEEDAVNQYLLKQRSKYEHALQEGEKSCSEEEKGPEESKNKQEEEEIDMFSEQIEELILPAKTPENNVSVDDDEGYLIFRGNLILGLKYQLKAYLGRGVFSSVFLAHSTKKLDDNVVALKVIRDNEMMQKCGEKELGILKELEDPLNQHHVIQLVDNFYHQNHLCLVLEAMSLNLRKLNRKFGQGDGLSLQATWVFARHLFKALKFVHSKGIIHADLKPDNIVVNNDHSCLKLCDFGSAYFFKHEGKLYNETPYLVSRYYRAPEIILGLGNNNFMIDIWSAGCSLYELFTGRILFPAKSNNESLKKMQELLGPFSKKLLKKAQFLDDHFDGDFNFLYSSTTRNDSSKIDEVLLQVITPKPKVELNLEKKLLMFAGKELKKNSSSRYSLKKEKTEKNISMLANLLENCLQLDPNKRFNATQALKHPFFKQTM